MGRQWHKKDLRCVMYMYQIITINVITCCKPELKYNNKTIVKNKENRPRDWGRKVGMEGKGNIKQN